MKKLTPISLILISTAFYSLAYANNSLPGQTVFEFRLSGDEIDIGGKRIVTSNNNVVAKRRTVNFERIDGITASTLIEVDNGDGTNSHYVGNVYRSESGQFIAGTEEIANVVELHVNDKSQPVYGHAMTVVDPLDGTNKFYHVSYGFSGSGYEATKYDYDWDRVYTGWNDSFALMPSITEGPFFFGTEYLYNVYDESANLWLVNDYRGTSITGTRVSDAFDDVDSFYVTGGTDATYVQFVPYHSDAAQDGRRGEYTISALRWKTGYPIPLYNESSTTHSSVFGATGYTSNRNVVHIEGQKQINVVSERDYYHTTNYDLVFDRVDSDGTWQDHMRVAMPLHFRGNIASRVSHNYDTSGTKPVHQFIFIQQDEVSGRRYLTLVEANSDYYYGNAGGRQSTYAKETLFEIPDGLQISIKTDAKFMFNDSASELIISAIWTIPNGNRNQEEDIAAVVVLNESDIHDVYDSRVSPIEPEPTEPEPTEPETDEEEPADTDNNDSVVDTEVPDPDLDESASAGGSIPVTLFALLCGILCFTRYGKR